VRVVWQFLNMASSNSNKKEWSKDQTIDLIEKYEEKSVLWDHKNKEYRNREKKNKAAKLLSILYFKFFRQRRTCTQF
jgi:hypothetical protein